MTPGEEKLIHDKDFAILTLQIGYMNESQKRIEDLLKTTVMAVDRKLDILDEKHTKNYEKVDEKLTVEMNKNLKFRTKVAAYSTIGAVAGSGVWQLLVLLIKK